MYIWVEQMILYVTLQKYSGLRTTKLALWISSCSPEQTRTLLSIDLVFFKNTIGTFFSRFFTYSM